jgi:hypothetical protein
MDQRSRGAPIGEVFAIVGGVALATGSFLTWAKVSGGGVSVTAKGIDGSDGWVTLVSGVAALAAGVAALRAGRRVLAVIAILAGLVGGGLGVYDAITAKDSVLNTAAEELAPQFGATPDQIRGVLDDAVDAGQLSISVELGLYVVIGGGVLALVGGVLMMTRAGRAAAPAPVESAGLPIGSEAPVWETAAPPEAPPAPPIPPAPPAPPDVPPSSV